MRYLDDFDNRAGAEGARAGELDGQDVEHLHPQQNSGDVRASSPRLGDELRDTIESSKLSPDAASRMLKNVYERLEERIQQHLGERLSADEFAEFDAYFARDDAAGAFKWLRATLPEYDLLVAEESSRLADDLRRQLFADIASGQVAPPGNGDNVPCSR